MTATQSDQVNVPIRRAPDSFDTAVDRGSGWLIMAGTVLGIAGLMRIVDSIWAFSYNGALPENLQDGILGDNLTTYAWTWLIVGLVLIASSVMILTRSQFARWIGFTAAAIGCITAMAWMPYYPVWSFAYIGLSMLVIYALASYGGPEFKEPTHTVRGGTQ